MLVSLTRGGDFVVSWPAAFDPSPIWTHCGQRRAIAASYRYKTAPGDHKEMSGKRGQPSLSGMDGGPQTASRRNAQVNVIELCLLSTDLRRE